VGPETPVALAPGDPARSGTATAPRGRESRRRGDRGRRFRRALDGALHQGARVVPGRRGPRAGLLRERGVGPERRIRPLLVVEAPDSDPALRRSRCAAPRERRPIGDFRDRRLLPRPRHRCAFHAGRLALDRDERGPARLVGGSGSSGGTTRSGAVAPLVARRSCGARRLRRLISEASSTPRLRRFNRQLSRSASAAPPWTPVSGSTKAVPSSASIEETPRFWKLRRGSSAPRESSSR
jgi:hypothetical protein